MGRNSELIRQWTLLRQLAATRTNTIPKLAEGPARHHAPDPAISPSCGRPASPLPFLFNQIGMA
jgi:hypothetical protein